MGYENSIYIAHKSPSDLPDGSRLCFVLGSVNLSNLEGIYDLFKKSNCWFLTETETQRLETMLLAIP